MKRMLSFAVLIAAGTAALTGCGGAGEAAQTAPTTATTAAVSPTAAPSTAMPTPTGPPRSARGNIIKVPGQTGTMRNLQDELLYDFTVKSIAIDPPCAHPYTAKKSLVVLDIDMRTYPALAKEQIPDFTMFSNGWSVIDENGTRVNGDPMTYGCLSSEEHLPGGLQPGDKASGKLAFDVPATGTLVFQGYSDAGKGGWEWSYPAK